MLDWPENLAKTFVPGVLPLNGGVMVTGATGFLGALVVRRLLQAGQAPEQLRCLVRNPARAAGLGLPQTSLVAGDLADPESGERLRAAAAGITTVLHLAGTLKGWRPEHFDAVNADGTARLVAAVAAVAPAAHFVHVSSLAAAGPSCDGAGSANPPDRCRPVSLYGASKLRGEQHVVRSPLAWTVIRPPIVYGAGDAATALMFRQACAWLAAVPRVPRPLSVMHADDVVDAVLAAASLRERGCVLPLDGPERTDTHAFVRAMAAACGRRARLLPVPMPLAFAAAVVSELWGRMRGDVGYFNRDKVREIRARGWIADGGPVAAALRFVPRIGMRDGLAAVASATGWSRQPGRLT